MIKKERNLDKIRGSLIGGAVGDALGYTVEFLSLEQIRLRFGRQGIIEYVLDEKSGKALISDDTQMTLFTANGILYGNTRLCMRGIGADPHVYVTRSYQDWLTTQEVDYETGSTMERYQGNRGGVSWLLDVPELYARRVPGNTCMTALMEARKKEPVYKETLFKKPRNNSKGCGGIMRIAPLSLYYGEVSISEIDMEAALLSAITHGHPLGYMPSAVLAHIIHRIVYPVDGLDSLKSIVLEAKKTVCDIFKGNEYLQELCDVIDRAIAFSENNRPDDENIKKLGEGWVAEETLGIALYCSLKYENDFSTGIIAAVNHNGDSDSTGAVVGNILGAINGYDALEDKWKDRLEILDVLLEMADDLYYGCQMSEYGSYYDEAWYRKYIGMHWKEKDNEIS